MEYHHQRHRFGTTPSIRHLLHVLRLRAFRRASWPPSSDSNLYVVPRLRRRRRMARPPAGGASGLASAPSHSLRSFVRPCLQLPKPTATSSRRRTLPAADDPFVLAEGTAEKAGRRRRAPTCSLTLKAPRHHHGHRFEVQWAVSTARPRLTRGIKARVVSAPSLEWFEEQDAEYKEACFGLRQARVSVGAGVAMPWCKPSAPTASGFHQAVRPAGRRRSGEP